MDREKDHWNKIYATKLPNEVSWTQTYPETSLNFFHSFKLPKSASIIDIGGGDSYLVDFLLQEGYENITVLDISVKALERAQLRLGSKAEKVKWIVSDVNDFTFTETYDWWPARATFHFMVTNTQISKYITNAYQAINPNTYMTIGTFSEDGPTKCSGLEIKQYSEELLASELEERFEKLRCVKEDHITPFNTKQNFLYCSFKKVELPI